MFFCAVLLFKTQLLVFIFTESNDWETAGHSQEFCLFATGLIKARYKQVNVGYKILLLIRKYGIYLL